MERVMRVAVLVLSVLLLLSGVALFLPTEAQPPIIPKEDQNFVFIESDAGVFLLNRDTGDTWKWYSHEIGDGWKYYGLPKRMNGCSNLIEQCQNGKRINPKWAR